MSTGRVCLQGVTSRIARTLPHITADAHGSTCENISIDLECLLSSSMTRTKSFARGPWRASTAIFASTAPASSRDAVIAAADFSPWAAMNRLDASPFPRLSLCLCSGRVISETSGGARTPAFTKARRWTLLGPEEKDALTHDDGISPVVPICKRRRESRRHPLSSFPCTVSVHCPPAQQLIPPQVLGHRYIYRSSLFPPLSDSHDWAAISDRAPAPALSNWARRQKGLPALMIR